MKFQLFSLLVIAVAYASLTYKPAAEEPAEPGLVDFAGLYNQANTALESLQTSQAQRTASANAQAAAF
jgi:hypothetical protein